MNRSNSSILLAGALLAAGIACAEGVPPPPGTGPEGRRGPGRDMGRQEEPGQEQENAIHELLRNPETAERAGVSREQIEQLKTALAGVREEFPKLRAALEKAGMEQAALMTAERLDEAALMAAVEKAGAIRTEMAKLRVKSLLAVRNTLSPEQINRVRAMSRERPRRPLGEHWRERHEGAERRRDGGPGIRPPVPPPDGPPPAQEL